MVYMSMLMRKAENENLSALCQKRMVGLEDLGEITPDPVICCRWHWLSN